MNLIISFLLIMILLPSCAPISPPGLVAHIAKYHNLEPNDLQGSFAIAPANEQQRGSLEFSHYKEILAEELLKRGLREVAMGKEPDFIINVTYSIDSGRTGIRGVPIIGQTGGGYTTYSGISGSNPVFGSSYTAPTFDTVGVAPQSYLFFTRQVNIDFYDGASFRTGKLNKRYEAKIISRGTSSELERAFPYMVQALFKDFPGKSGEPAAVKVEIHEEKK